MSKDKTPWLAPDIATHDIDLPLRLWKLDESVISTFDIKMAKACLNGRTDEWNKHQAGHPRHSLI